VEDTSTSKNLTRLSFLRLGYCLAASMVSRLFVFRLPVSQGVALAAADWGAHVAALTTTQGPGHEARRFSEEQIVGILKEHEAGWKIAELSNRRVSADMSVQELANGSQYGIRCSWD
jgi:hypothetical protein